MSDEFGPDFITVTDDEGNDIELEFIDSLEHEGVRYMAFFPAQTEDTEDEVETEIIILKAILENGEELLSTPDTEEELQTVYDLFMEQIFSEEEDDE